MIADSGHSAIGGAILLASVGVTIWQCIVRTDDSPWYGRVAIVVIAVAVVSGIVGAALDIVGLDVGDDEDATVALRDELSAASYLPAEIDCVEAAVTSDDGGSVDAIVDAADVTPFLVALMSCNADVGMDASMIECWAGALVDHFDIDRFDADGMAVVSDAVTKPEHRRFATVTALTCQGLPEGAAECMYDTVTAAHPAIIGDDAPGLTEEEQGWLFDAGRECGVSS
jgi:hypothetical protein